MSVNLYGAPAMRMKDFASYKQDWIVGVALKVSAPSGQYDDTRLVNIGDASLVLQAEPRCFEGHRSDGHWRRRRPPRSTRTTRISTAALRDRRPRSIRFKGTSSAVFATGFGPQWTPRISRAADRRSMGRENNDLQQNWRVGATLALPINRTQFDQALRQQRSLGPHRRQLQAVRHRVAVSLGRRNLIACQRGESKERWPEGRWQEC